MPIFESGLNIITHPEWAASQHFQQHQRRHSILAIALVHTRAQTKLLTRSNSSGNEDAKLKTLHYLHHPKSGGPSLLAMASKNERGFGCMEELNNLIRIHVE
eukprot:c1913_g1_i1 orf=228-533(+)